VHDLSAALSQSWPPFALIAGLLLIGLLADRDGLFAWGGGRLQRLPGGAAVLLVASLLLVMVVTAVLNLDTAVLFLTPVLVLAARHRGVGVEPFLYGCVFMANASSLFLPGSNLTNLLVLGQGPGASGGAFAAEMAPIAFAAALVTLAGVLLLFRRPLMGGGEAATAPAPVWPGVGVGVVATALATALVLALRQPALTVLVVGLLATAVELARGRVTLGAARAVVGPVSLLGAFALTVALGTLARGWAGPAELIDGAGAIATAGLAALTTVVINNLPAAALYSAHSVGHPRQLLLGLNVGPNLAPTGALSALLWFRAAGAAGERPSLLEFSRRGIPLALAALAAALLAGSL
jgi:arsenical pump membrane protein